MPNALRRQIGQLLIAGFNGHQIPSELRSLAKDEVITQDVSTLENPAIL